MRMEMYVLDGWVYMKMAAPDVPSPMSGWMKFQVPAGYWEDQDVAAQQLDLLESTFEVELLGTDVVDGIECYKLRVTPDLEKLRAWAQRRIGMEGVTRD